MRYVLVIVTVAAMAVARPDMYKEKEDFQYSRSSSDEGTKSGFYGAQRGNMGGNYERAHNMDLLAQHQMGGLVRTVEGDLGDGAKQKSGSAFSAANSRGVYGSGHYDLSNVQGRNFQESTSLRNSQAQSLSSQQAGYGSQSQSYSSAANSAHGRQSQSSQYGYNTGSEQALYANNMQSADNLQSASQYNAEQSSQGSGYHSQTGYQRQSDHDQIGDSYHTSYGTSGTRGSHYRLVGASPVRVYIRPGSTVAIPVAAQTFDTSQGSSSIYDQNSSTQNQNSQGSASTSNHNSINSEAEVLGRDYQNAYKPTNDAKHYESSYKYHKEWEKHDTVTNAPLAVPTVNPYSSNSELYEDTQAHGQEQHEASAQEARNVHSSSQYRGYNIKSGSSRHHAASRAQEHSSSSDAAASNLASANTQGAYNGASGNLNSGNLNSQVENFGSQPKTYQSSYSYHKSWEHQGDPYVIKPSSNGIYAAADSQASQRLTSSSSNQGSGYRSQRYGSHNHQGQQGYSYDPDCDCDVNGHIRVARSYNLGRDQSTYQQSQNINEGQQSQNLEYLGQQSQNLEDLRQQFQNLGDFGQESQNLQDFDQQSQNVENLGLQSEHLEDLGQQLQNVGQESQNLEDFGQQSQNLQDFGQQSQTLEDFGQQTQDVGQLTQGFDRTEDLGQQAQNQWDEQSQTDAGQQTQNTWSTLDTQHNYSDRDTQKQSNGMEHTGFDHQETQGSVFEINHPSQNQPESHTTQENKTNSFADTIFNEHRPDQETPILGKDSETEVPRNYLTRQPGQQTFWQAFSPNINEHNQNGYVPISPFDTDKTHQEVPSWQKYLEHSTAYGHNGQNDYQTVYGANTWMIQPSNNYKPYPYVDTGFHSKPSTYSHYPNTLLPTNLNTEFRFYPWRFPSSYSHNPNTNIQHPENANTQTYISHSNHSTYSTSNLNVAEETGSTSLNNFWNLIDETDKQMTTSKETEFSSHPYQENIEYVQTNSTAGFMQNFNNSISSHGNSNQNSTAPLLSTTETNLKTTTIKQNNLHRHDVETVERGDIESESEKQKPQEEAGRGDIGPEENDSSNNPNKLLEILKISSNKPSVHKTPEEIETLSLIKKDNKTAYANSHSQDVDKLINIKKDDKEFESELGVMSLDDQKKLEPHLEIDNWKVQRDIQKMTSNTPKSSYHHIIHPHLNVEQQTQQNTDQQDENIDQQSYNQFEGFNQQNMNHQLGDFSRQENLRQKHKMEEQQIEILGQQKDLNQQNYEKNKDLGQETENLGQLHQQFGNLGQQSEGFQQESLSDIGQQSEGLQQETLGDIGQLSEDFQQERLGNIGQQSEGFEQESLGELGQQSEDFQQDTLGEFGQQSENLGQEHQHFDNFGQQSEGFQQESLNGLEQHGQSQQESLSNFNHKSDNTHPPEKDQQLENWGKQNENLEQQSQSEDILKPNSEQHKFQVETFIPPATYYKADSTPSHSDSVNESEFVTKKTNNVDTPPEAVTEKASFWNKVGSKFVGAKDKVKSWFSSS